MYPENNNSTQAGDRRIGTTYNPTPGVYLYAFSRGSKIIIVAVNKNTSATYQPFTLSGVTVPGFDRWVTSPTKNIAQGTRFAISGGSWGNLLDAQSTTTFVSY